MRDIEAKFEAKKRKTRHWFHIILLAVTMGFYLPVYMIVCAIHQKHNEAVDNQLKGYLLAVADINNGGA